MQHVFLFVLDQCTLVSFLVNEPYPGWVNETLWLTSCTTRVKNKQGVVKRQLCKSERLCRCILDKIIIRDAKIWLSFLLFTHSWSYQSQKNGWASNWQRLLWAALACLQRLLEVSADDHESCHCRQQHWRRSSLWDPLAQISPKHPFVE